MNNADFDTPHPKSSSPPGDPGSPVQAIESPQKPGLNTPNPRNPATHHQPTVAKRQPAVLRDSPNPRIYGSFTVRSARPRGSLQKSRTHHGERARTPQRSSQALDSLEADDPATMARAHLPCERAARHREIPAMPANGAHHTRGREIAGVIRLGTVTGDQSSSLLCRATTPARRPAPRKPALSDFTDTTRPSVRVHRRRFSKSSC